MFKGSLLEPRLGPGACIDNHVDVAIPLRTLDQRILDKLVLQHSRQRLQSAPTLGHHQPRRSLSVVVQQCPATKTQVSVWGVGSGWSGWSGTWWWWRR